MRLDAVRWSRGGILLISLNFNVVIGREMLVGQFDGGCLKSKEASKVIR